MLASRLYGTEDIRLDDVPDVDPGDGRGAGQGRAQRHLRQRPPHVLPEGQSRRSRARFTLGHEFSGVIDTLGAGVTGIAARHPGGRAAVLPVRRIATAARAASSTCARRCKVLGCGAAEGGGLAEYCVTDADMVFALPDGVSRSSRARSSSRWRCRTTASSGARSRPGCAR